VLAAKNGFTDIDANFLRARVRADV
jgi:hypothetical protein